MKKKQIYLWAFVMLSLFFAACSGADQSQEESENNTEKTENENSEIQKEEVVESPVTLIGSWSLSEVEKEGEGAVELSACDREKVFKFTQEMDQPLGDGTEVMKLEVTAEGECASEAYSAKYTTLNGQLYLSKLRTDGLSNSGLFNIQEHTSDKLIISVMKYTYTFTRN